MRSARLIAVMLAMSLGAACSGEDSGPRRYLCYVSPDLTFTCAEGQACVVDWGEMGEEQPRCIPDQGCDEAVRHCRAGGMIRCNRAELPVADAPDSGVTITATFVICQTP